MQLALSSYLQVCFSITNDVVMSISLMFEKPESGMHPLDSVPVSYVLMNRATQTSCSASLVMPERTG